MLRGRGRPARRWTGWRPTASRGDIWGYAEGETYFPYSPLLIVEAPFAEAVLLETVLLSIYNHDSAIASAASRMTLAAGDRPCIEMGSRRTHEEAAVAAARAAYVAGFATTSNLARPPAVRRPDRRHQRAQLHAAARLRGARPSARRSTRSARAPPCWSTPTTSPRRCGWASRSPGPASAPSGSTPATSARWPTRCAPSSTSWAPPTPGSSSPPTSTSSRSPRWPRPRSTGTASAPSW